ncbi:MAG: tetratricopeptide repeat protein [Candidatus Berkiellales bacterium]
MKQVAKLLLPLFLLIPEISQTQPLLKQDPQFELQHQKSNSTSLEGTLNPKKVTPAGQTANHKSLTSNQIPADSLYQLLAAEVALDRQNPEVALANYIAAARETQDGSIAARAAQIALSMSSLQDALEPAQIWAKAEPNNLEAQITTAALFLRLDQPSGAVPYLRHAEEVNADEAVQYYLILFRQLPKPIERERLVEALKLLAKENTKEKMASLALAEIYINKGEYNQALQMSKDVLQHNPESSSAIQFYVQALAQTQGKDAAKTYCDKKIAALPNNIELKQFYAQFLFDNGYTKEAKVQTEHLLKNPNLSAEELLQFARLCIQAQWFDLAKTTLTRASKFDDTKDLSHYFLARVAEMEDNSDVALEWYKQVLTGPFHILSQIRASILLTEKKQYEEALKILSHTQPNDFADSKLVLLATIDVLNDAKRYQESLNLLNNNIKIVPDDIELLYSRSLVADQLGKLNMAEADLKAILALQPKHLDALNALGYLLANKTTRFDEAQGYLSQALKLAPDNPFILDSLGWLYYKMGNNQQAVQTLQKAAKLSADGDIAAHLGEVMWQIKDYNGAKQVWNKALSLQPKHEQIIKVMQRLMGK